MQTKGTFSAFLKEKREQLKFHSTRELFQHFGSEQKLGVSFRQFQNIENGTTPPSVELLSRVFEMEPVASRHLVVQAFFASHLKDNSHGKPLLSYVSKHLTQALEEGSFDWSERPHRPYSETQLDYMTSTPDAMRFHRRLMLAESVARKDCPLSEKTLKEMERLELITLTKANILPAINRYRLPIYGKAAPRMVAKAHDFIVKHLELFAAKEGSPNQEMAYACQLVEPWVAKAAREQVRLLKEWIQSHVSLKAMGEDETLVPLVFVGFCKGLERGEISG